MKTTEILNAVLEHTGKSINGLANAIGLLRSQNLYDILNGKVKKISPELSEKICAVFPEINRAWLLTGEGEMLLSETKTGTDTEKELMRKRIQDLETIVELQKKIIDSKSEPEKQSMPSEKPEKLKKAN